MNPPTDPNAAPETTRLLEYFYSISGLRTLSGQQCLYWDWHKAGSPNTLVRGDQHVMNKIGKTPAVFGVDFGDNQDAGHLQKTVDLIKQEADRGRIITVSYHFKRPLGNSAPQPSGTLTEVIDPANTVARPSFFTRIDQLIALLRMLDTNGARVPVIFRPFHEMNASWFWWGKNAPALKTLWKEVWNRFHNNVNPADNLHNVLWMFSANAWPVPANGAIDSPTTYYPSDPFVDMLGVDVYKEKGHDWRKEYHDDLRALGANRPIAITENGQLPDISDLRNGGQTHWVYWLTWFDRYGTAAAGDGDLPDNTDARYQALLKPSVVWSDPDIYVSDVPADIGLTIPSAEFVDDGPVRHWWYESPDIKVDANPASAADLTDAVNFGAFIGESPKRNATNNLYVRVHNHGPAFAHSVKVKCLWTDASAGIPPLPADYWQYFPEAWTAASAWNPVDAANPYGVIASIPPRSSRIAKIPWQVPATAAAHTCVFAMATCAGDALVGNTTTGVRNEKRVALRNLHVVDNPAFPVKMLVHMYPVRPFIKIGELAIDPGELQGGRVTVAIDQRSERPLRPLDGKTMSFRPSESATTGRGVRRFELDLPRQARRSLAPAHLPRISGIELSPERPAVVEIEWSPAEQLEPDSTHVLRVLQFESEMPQGGSTFVIRMPSQGRGGRT